MSEKRLFNAISRIALLQMLNTKEFITSKRLRDKFSPEFNTIFYLAIESFRNLGWIETLEKDGEFAGDDRREYKLTAKGEELREKLVNEIRTLIEPFLMKNKEDKIDNILTEFSTEWQGKINDKTLKEQIKILKKSLKEFL